MKDSFTIKQKARLLRKKGLSLGAIGKELHVPKTTIHSWVSDLVISEELQRRIKVNALSLLQEGRIRVQKEAKEKRSALQNSLLRKGAQRVGHISERELFIAGIALYWGEGFKNNHERRLGFCNSDPAMVKFYLHWLKTCLHVRTQDIVARVSVNKIYESKITEIEMYWSQVIGIPLGQFTKPFYQNAKWEKQFEQENYYGVMRIHVKNSLEDLLEMKGWIKGLKANTPG